MLDRIYTYTFISVISSLPINKKYSPNKARQIIQSGTVWFSITGPAGNRFDSWKRIGRNEGRAKTAKQAKRASRARRANGRFHIEIAFYCNCSRCAVFTHSGHLEGKLWVQWLSCLRYDRNDWTGYVGSVVTISFFPSKIVQNIQTWHNMYNLCPLWVLLADLNIKKTFLTCLYFVYVSLELTMTSWYSRSSWNMQLLFEFFGKVKVILNRHIANIFTWTLDSWNIFGNIWSSMF